jgi:magnesium-protoporphyrin IX monomethyl ester (oxidative) cyclase
MKKHRKYTFFKPKYIFYSTYLSEKIGYFRYIAIFRHLEKHPEQQLHPLFNYFENWCQDENRHGDFIGLVIRSQPELLKGLNLLWIRFFLTAVFVTMYLNDHKEPDFYRSLGLDPTAYAKEVLHRTNRESGKLFPVILNMDALFWNRIERCNQHNQKLAQATSPLQKLPHQLGVAWNYFQIWWAKPLRTDLRTVR